MRAALAVFALLLAACSSAQDEEIARRLAGRWHVEYTRADNGRTYRFLNERRPNGEFVLRYRIYQDDRLVSQHEESGDWRIVGGKYRTRTLKVDGNRVPGADPYFFDTYDILKLDDREFVYRHTRVDLTFRVRRVSADHQLP
jgi:hypothetical protein